MIDSIKGLISKALKAKGMTMKSQRLKGYFKQFESALGRILIDCLLWEYWRKEYFYSTINIKMGKNRTSDTYP
ncbi:hypothetical protein [Sphingobacterium faecium]|uniref:hypothetical protein n=1 Tax=Sphingobacterium faecium TaxID=34087 RepID=UPI00320A0680